MPGTDQQQNESLVAVVVTFNRLEKLKETVARLLESPASDLQAVLVVDNCSTDGTWDWLQAQDHPQLHVHRTEYNSGGAGGFEIGMRLADEKWNPDWMVIMDDDGRPAKGGLRAFHERKERGFDAYASAVYYPAGGICDMNRPSYNPFWHLKSFFQTAMGGGRAGFHLTDEDYDRDEGLDIDATSFVGLFISRKAIEKTGYPDGRLFIYGDDVLYTILMRKAGCSLRFSPDIRFEHDFGTFTEEDRRFKPLWKSYYHHRNLMLVYREAAGWWFLPVLFVILPKWLLKGLGYPGQRKPFYRLLIPAIVDGLTHRFHRKHPEIVALSE